MLDVGTVYLVAAGALLLVALAVGVRALVRIFREGRERRRKRREGELDRYTKDPEYDREPPDPEAASRSTCPQCGAENDASFAFCRECAAPLGPGA
ncbi:zinc ribbon domain-containing protein [Halorubrum sp. SS7]|uniref:Zinc ribbon domain-containing protein n=1 Tax=Halorubrum salinarum TaxID=2739057 RepID=A0A7D3XZZ6_9EURY|nr:MULTISPECIES: zinc ribbon domain-containing protein [Halorubrum]QKG92512.1 zinc ribbon domain-containing protein [Halorubrum salinarum]TKX57555.1 zinc ribbon domain-containing protein [Halorubrum sp. SS7]